jgi:hypothetical protein
LQNAESVDQVLVEFCNLLIFMQRKKKRTRY